MVIIKMKSAQAAKILAKKYFKILNI